jgi:hypothetical protein
VREGASVLSGGGPAAGAVQTVTVRSRPRVSVTMNRLRPLTRGVRGCRHQKPSRLVERSTVVPRPAEEEPAELTVNIEEIVSDPEFGAQLRRRLDEAHGAGRRARRPRP